MEIRPVPFTSPPFTSPYQYGQSGDANAFQQHMGGVAASNLTAAATIKIGQTLKTPAAKGIVAQDGTKISGYTKHGLNRAIGDGAKRAGVKPAAILDAVKNTKKISSGVDKLGRPFKIYQGQNARVVVNPNTGRVISLNPLSGAGVR